MKATIADALLRRKELGEKVAQLHQIKNNAVYETRCQRIKVTDGIDEVTAAVPKLTASQVTREYDYYARLLRLVDAAIQRANWTTEIDLNDDAMLNFDEKKFIVCNCQDTAALAAAIASVPSPEVVIADTPQVPAM